ncbi:MAG: enoyl-CoA hydratase-related protein, partial [Patescibacteria group bacterium]|nr:enoyl-CoA hydratase-related protein [Patescibacteria group bacterium]
GEEAYRIGLVNSISTPKNVLQKSRELAEMISANAPLAVSYAIESVYANMQSNKKEALLLESSLFGLTFTTKDKDEGLNAFFDKRDPVFTGK